ELLANVFTLARLGQDLLVGLDRLVVLRGLLVQFDPLHQDGNGVALLLYVGGLGAFAIRFQGLLDILQAIAGAAEDDERVIALRQRRAGVGVGVHLARLA